MIQRELFGRTSEGTEVNLFRIINKWGEYVELLDHGATIYRVNVLDKKGELGDVVLGPADMASLESGRGLIGMTIGRCANRIAYGRFSIDGCEKRLEQNAFGHFLHGASGNYGKKMFAARTLPDENAVEFSLRDTGEGGFDCEASVRVTMSFDDEHCLTIRYHMVGEGDTLLCPTNHAYWNLDGEGSVEDHILSIPAENYAVKGPLGMPEGGKAPVAGTPFDFRREKAIKEAFQGDVGEYFSRVPPELDDIFLPDACQKRQTGTAARLISRKTGRTLTVATDMPSLIVFTMYMKHPAVGKDGKTYDGYASVALETQFVPNAVNCADFDSPLFRKGEALDSSTSYTFGVL